MEFEGSLSVNGASLIVQSNNADWYFAVRRMDGKAEAAFWNYYGKVIKSSDIAIFVPNWALLDWTGIANSMISKSESYAIDRDFKINVMGKETGNKDHQEVIDAFLAFMKT